MTPPHGLSFRHLYGNAPCGLLITATDGTITEVNETFLEWTGYTKEQLVGTSFASYLEAGSRIFYETRHMPVLYLEGSIREVSLSVQCADGRELPVLVNSTIETDPDPIIHTAVFDATSRQEYERELLLSRRLAEASEARVRTLQEVSAAFALSLTEQDVCDALYTWASEAFGANATGVFLLDDDGQLVIQAGTNPVVGLIPPREQRASEAALVEEKPLTVLASDESGQFPIVTAALQVARLEAVTIIPLLRNGVPLGVLACFYARQHDFDEAAAALQSALARQASQALVRVRLQLELERLALHDQLTGLANRRLIQDTVSAAIEAADRSPHPLSIIFLDLDGFKGVNDQLGHTVGDRALTVVAERIRSGVRYQDAVGRFGGDEFVIICEDADQADAAAIADRVRSNVGEPIEGIPSHLPLTASVGVATYLPGERETPSNDELLSLADSAMYLAKSAGKDRIATLRR
ncbi:hypothetical protein BH10ACT7_BH10ACT7_28850 [soil metagenome]